MSIINRSADSSCGGSRGLFITSIEAVTKSSLRDPEEINSLISLSHQTSVKVKHELNGLLEQEQLRWSLFRTGL